ncbi:MAG: chromosome segregation protein, partial [Bacteroidota bacterium]
MRLKSLEIKGFKSFADKTVLNFDEGITGVIGPNGCGKSNIIDSIRWVIGEHKISNLRSENLESLVFNGSKTRNASGLAEVSLTFENTKNLLPTEFNTVTITRKYYKSGESEYRLNDVSCRLKDIHNLFMDTGVSTDSYAIIELGMVDDIIKDKENSRRKMLEQAAGITIYKTRKKEAKLKLDAAEQDLARIEDLLFEINNQLKTLESQAKKAEKYYEIKKEYKEISIELAKAALEGFNITYRELNQQQQQEVDKRIELETEIAKEEAALEQERVAFIEKEKELQQLQQSFNETLDQVRQKENDKNLAAQKLQHLNERKLNLDDFLKKAEGQVAGLNESITFTGNQVEEEKQKLADLESQLQTFQSEVEGKRKTFDDQRVELDQFRRSFQSIQKSQFEAEKKVAVADTGIQNILRSLQQLEEEKLIREKSIADIQLEKDAKSADLEASKSELTQMQEDQDRLKAQILEAQQALEAMRQVLAEENRKLDSRKNEYDLLKSLVDSMEGYPESVKFLHKNSNWGKQAPLLSDIIYVKEEYRAAVENVLEPFLNYYVVDCLEDGIKAISLLEENKKGKANFFMLDRLQNTSTSNMPSNTISALDVVEVDDAFMPLAKHLLGNVFIAMEFSALQDESDAVILEKTGKMVKGKYALSGGSVGLFEGKKIGRAKNLEKMFADIQEQESIVKAKKDEIQQKHDQVIDYNSQLKEQAIRQLSQKVNDLTNQIFVLQNKLENLTSQNNNAENRIGDLNKSMSAQQDAIAATREELAVLNENLNSLQEQIQNKENDYNSAEQAYNEASNAYNNANLMLTRQQSKISSLQQEFDFKSNQLQNLFNQMEESKQQLLTSESAIAETAVALSELELAVVELLKTKDEAEKILNLKDQEYYNTRTLLNQKESELRLKQRSKEGIDQLLNEIKDRLTELKLQLAGMKERLHVEFRIDLDAIIDEPRTGDTPLEELQEKSERMKKRLENIGEVNPTAIEAFTEMKKRYEFILEQKNDLVTAKDSLMQTIQEVEATANQQFLDTFNKTRENFQKVFKALFTEEDTADMILVDPNNLAETGIDIVAKPKGKRPSSIGQLSGGEKTLTATALLFAIYLIKPAPFCILDEVDAPLDDANVGKFTGMIKQFSENSQFIIVTHNKMTMSAVDVIYG